MKCCGRVQGLVTIQPCFLEFYQHLDDQKGFISIDVHLWDQGWLETLDLRSREQLNTNSDNNHLCGLEGVLHL